MSEWNFTAGGDSQPGTLTPRVPRHRPVLRHVEGRPVQVLLPGRCVNDCDQGRRACTTPLQCRSRTGDTLKGALVGAALALAGVLALHLWSL